MARKAKRPRAKPEGWVRRIIRWIVGGLLFFIVFSLVWVAAYRFLPPPITFTQIGDLIAGNGIRRDWMSLDRIDRDMVRAVIAAEDSKFCTHRGFDQDAIAAAMRRNARGGSVIRGGSTISQQTAKNAFLWQGGGYFRKGIEAWFTVLIERLWDKRRIMEVYLNVAETGIGTYGVNAGSRRYFGHDASSMTRTEAARIAAILPLPKKRGAIAPHGFTRRYGNSIAGRIGIVARDALDACIYQGAHAQQPADIPEPKKETPRREAPPLNTAPEPEVLPPNEELPGEEYEAPATPPDAAPPAAPTDVEPTDKPLPPAA